eukprot:4332361-Ditylum_brightwellii.AAC.1
MENKQDKKVRDKDEVEASPPTSVDGIKHSASSSSTSTIENKQDKKVRDKDEVEASPSSFVDVIEHSASSSSTLTNEIIRR